MDPDSLTRLIIYIVLIVVLLFLSALFSLTETAFSCTNEFKMRVYADDGNKAAKRVLKRLELEDQTLIMSLIGHNLVNVVLSTISTILFVLLLSEFISETWITVISTIVMTLLTYVIGDMMPKMIAKTNPEIIAMKFERFASFFGFIFFPLIWLLSLLTKLVNKIFKIDDIPSMTQEDFENVVEAIEEEGGIEDNESDIIYASLEFTETTVKEVLTKRSKMFVIDLKDCSKEDIKNIVLETSYSRIPVCYENKDKIVGILHVKRYIESYLKNPNISVLSLLQKPYFVSTKTKLDDILEGFKKNKTHIAIVKQNEKVVGMVTMEDVLEELVGKIAEPTKLKGEKE